LILVACQALWLWHAYHEDQKEVRQTALATAEAYAITIQEALQQGHDIITLLKVQFGPSASLSSCQTLLDSQLNPLDKAQLPDFSIAVFDAQGRARCHHGSLLIIPRDTDSMPWNIGSRHFFRRAKAEMATRVSGYFSGPQFREPVMAISTPILRQGTFGGLIIYFMPARRLTQLAMELQLPEDSWVWFLDRERRLAASSEAGTDWQANQLTETERRLVVQMERHCPGTMPWDGDGHQAIIACYRLHSDSAAWLADAGMVVTRWKQPALLESGRLAYLLIPTAVGVPFLLLFWTGNLLGLLRPLAELTERLGKRQLAREKHETPLWLSELKALRKRIRKMQIELERARMEKLALNKELAAAQQDLTEHEQELAERLRKAQLQKILFDHAPEGLVRIDVPNRSLKTANAAFCHMSGLASQDLAGCPFLAIHPPQAHERIEAILELLREGKEAEACGIAMRRPDGTCWYADIMAVPMRTMHGLVQEAIAVFHDATERVHVEQGQARRRREEGFRVSLLRILLMSQEQETLDLEVVDHLAAFFQGSSFALYRAGDADTLRLAAHAGTEEFPQDLTLPGDSTALFASQLLPMQQPPILQDATEEQARTVQLYPIGSEHAFAGVLAACLAAGPQDGQDRPDTLLEWAANQLATTWTSMDQRERLARYAREQEEQARLLAQANQELERANRTKDEFLATMSHELRTPLNAIIGFSEVLRDELAGPLSPEQLDYTREILRAGQHLLELINDILDLAKIEAGRMALDAAPADMAELCRTAQRMVRERAANKNITLTLELGEEMTTELMLDQRKVKQILLNLLSNAIKFTPAGGTITVRCARVGSEAILVHRHEPGFRPPPHAIAPGPYLELRVEDNGIGIAPENLGRLFAPFEQLDSSLSRHYEGTGLGLSLVKRFAELHGGLVHVDSTPGEGSTFVVWLPWREARE
jgi:PAS domain S-box-containing protein